MTKGYRNRIWLEEKYINEELTPTKIANICNCSKDSIYKYLRKLKIPVRNYSESQKLRYKNKPKGIWADKAWLEQKYIKEKRSTYWIEKHYGVNSTSVYNWLKKHGLKPRDKREAQFYRPDKEKTRRRLIEMNTGKSPWNKGLTKKTDERLKKMSEKSRGKNAHNWQGGVKKTGNGYIYIYKPNHPFASKNYVAKHRLVAEKALGRYLKKNEVPHHINGNPSDNRRKNLIICNTHFHGWLEQRMANLYKKEHFGGL